MTVETLTTEPVDQTWYGWKELMEAAGYSPEEEGLFNRNFQRLTESGQLVLSLKYGTDGNLPLSYRQIGARLGESGQNIFNSVRRSILFLKKLKCGVMPYGKSKGELCSRTIVLTETKKELGDRNLLSCLGLTIGLYNKLQAKGILTVGDARKYLPKLETPSKKYYTGPYLQLRACIRNFDKRIGKCLDHSNQ